ncbi:fibronectin type III domain-containing protein [candidate division CSSED10-310 bacterium]|uniref:Fibronectin type III domain-containing protein n=1 Tax=candidate division CSSED10-310 bacterium TaxID=2855610 RepID=A0ABV6Z5M3_UNCC1
MLALGLSSMTMADARDWQNGILWPSGITLKDPVGVDSGGLVWSMYDQDYIPHNVIIGQDLTVLHTQVSSTNTSYEINKLRSKIDAELAKPPSQPAGLQVIDQRGDEIDLLWDLNVEQDLAGYELSYQSLAKSSRVVIDVGLKTQHTITLLDPDTSYEFTLRAYDLTNNYSTATDPVIGTTLSVPELSGWSVLILMAGLTFFLFSATAFHRKPSSTQA